MAKVTFLGLGVMGYPMAGHLAAKGHQVTVWNRTEAKSREWAAQHKGEVAKDPAAAAFGAEYVFLCLGDDPDVREVFDQLEPSLGVGMIVVDHTTASADVAREVDEKAKAAGVGFVDGPVSGGQAGAENGVLTVMCGGGKDDFERAQPVIDSYARAVTLLGDAGAGQLTKMVNQICIAGLVQGLSEGIAFAQNAGLDAKQVVDVISKGAAQSWQMENRGETMVDDQFEFGFAVEWMRKDLGIAQDEARNNGSRLPVTALVDQFYGEVVARGGARWDTSSLIRLLRG